MAIVEALKKLFKRVPGRVWLAVGGLLVSAFWLQQHDARIRQQARLQQLRNQTSAQVAALRRRAAQDVKQANVENAKAIAKIEQRRQQAEQQNRQLATQLARLRRQAQIQAGEVATLPISEIVTRVATQLGLKAGDVAETHTSQRTRRMRHPGKKTPHPAAGASTLSPRRGRGDAIRDSAVLPLTSSGARKVEGALVALNACRAESNIEKQQISNCQVRAEADETEVNHLQSSVASLNQALEAKDKILAQQQNECKAEVRAARGTFLGRLTHAAERVAIGMAMGVAIGVAVK